jgi:hypothetical protein
MMISARYEKNVVNYTQMSPMPEGCRSGGSDTNYKTAQTVYNAALAAVSEIIQTSLSWIFFEISNDTGREHGTWGRILLQRAWGVRCEKKRIQYPDKDGCPMETARLQIGAAESPNGLVIDVQKARAACRNGAAAYGGS